MIVQYEPYQIDIRGLSKYRCLGAPQLKHPPRFYEWRIRSAALLDDRIHVEKISRPYRYQAQENHTKRARKDLTLITGVRMEGGLKMSSSH
ncbi:AIF_HP2_G0052390.mRNA.1.CDS.1 [Saccharomyces cerevisiae]|nr:AIF_HP2_G0052390.mRNA.1.CDS.1 [Saccharomyces cerevisiae]CAI6798274.1 AIF_HP2_G0052390.mRNA.1.CDS.1 [Saccharomyces cerevisiae]